MAKVLAVRVDSMVRVPTRGLPVHAVVELAKVGVHKNPEHGKKRAMGYPTWGIPPVLKTSRWDKGRGVVEIPRGALGEVRRILREAGVPFRVEDHREEGAPHVPPLRYVGHEARPHQVGAAHEILRVEQGVVRAATGSGKTTTALYAASRIGLNTLIVLPNVKLMNQTARAAQKLLGLRPDQVGVIHRGKKRLRPLTVASQKTLWSRTVDADVRDYFGAVMIDEAHHVAARTFQEVVHQFPSRYRVAFTADETRADRKEFLVYDAFGGVISEFTRDDAEAAKVIVDVEVRILFSDYEDTRYAEDEDFNGLLDRMTADAARNALVERAVLAELRAGERVIVCSHRRDHARALENELVAAGVRCGQMLGDAGPGDAREFERTLAGLLDGSVRAGVGTYGALGEGIDLPAVGAGFMSTPMFSNRQNFGQVRGRICRTAPGKERGRLYVVFDRRVFPEKKLRNILAWNRNVTYRKGGRWVDARGLRGRRAIMSA